MTDKKKILFVAGVYSIHSARWINQLLDSDCEIHVASGVMPWSGVNPEQQTGIFYLPFPEVYPFQIRKKISRWGNYYMRKIIAKFPKYFENIQVMYLFLLIKIIKPDIIHSLGLNNNWKNYCLPVKKVLDLLPEHKRPPWIYSTWGADLDFYAKMSDQNFQEVSHILASVDYIITECKRDAELSRTMGFRGEYLGALPAFGGTNWEHISQFRSNGAVSSRKIIFLKGRDCQEGGDPVGRAMTAMEGFSQCKDLLYGYQIMIAQGSSVVVRAAKKLSINTGIKIKILPYTTYEEILELMGSSRIFISLTVNDGLPSSLVEAMALGVFPIHSDLSPIREWINHKQNGLLVPAEDSTAFAEALRLALSDDMLVNTAANINAAIIKERLADTLIKQKVLEIYDKIAGNGHKSK